VTLFVNWLLKPFSMALLGWIFIRHLFAPFLPADQLDSYIAGLILLAAAPCMLLGLSAIVVPVAIAQAWRSYLLERGRLAFEAAMSRIGPWSIGAPLVTLVLLFAFQGEEILQQPRVIAFLAVRDARLQ
jgi:ACR3 family arsenite transporter